MRATVRGVFTILALLLGAAAGLASPPQDDVYSGYQRYYHGDVDGAKKELEGLLAASPGRLPVRFGLLQILEHQADSNHALEPAFEKQIDAFIADAEGRYSRSSKDDEALFYLAN